MEEKDEKVFAWRRECLVRAGWSSSVAMELAKSKIDLRIAESAIKCGDEEKALYLLSVVDGI